jgi:molybdenum cofactor cytidylyltransferase
MNPTRHSAHVEILLLAAGPSKRMGTPKQSLPFKDTSLVRHLTREALASDAQGVTVVTGAWADHVRQELTGLPARLVHNEDWENGMASSLRKGVRSLPHITHACLMMLCDQPLVSQFSLNRIIEAYRSSSHLIVASEYGGIVGVPALYDRSLLPRFHALNGDQGARAFLRTTDIPTVLLPLPEAAVDLDTPDEYSSFLRSLH